MPGLHFFRAQRATMQFNSFDVAFECEAKGGVAVSGKKTEARTQLAREPDPVFCIKLRRALFGVAFLTDTPCFYRVQNLTSQGIVGSSKFQGPRFLDLGVANYAKTPEKFSAGFAEQTPGGVRIDLLKNGSERATAPEGNAEIVNGVFVRGSHHALALLEHAFHPIKQTLRFRCLRRKRNHCCHGERPQSAAPKPVGGSP